MKSDLLAPLALPVFMLLTECSPVAPPVARGGAHFHTARPPDATLDCTSAYGGIGNPPPEATPPTIDAHLHREGLVVDGELAAEGNTPYDISCRISGNGDLAIDARLEGLNTSPFRQDAGSKTNLTIKGTIRADGTGSGEVTFFTTPTKAVIPKENTTCTFTAAPAPLMACSNLSCLGGEEPGDYGGMALTFFCPDMTMGAAGIASDCEATGTVVLDRCTY